jgi:hypothetical protein
VSLHRPRLDDGLEADGFFPQGGIGWRWLSRGGRAANEDETRNGAACDSSG